LFLVHKFWVTHLHCASERVADREGRVRSLGICAGVGVATRTSTEGTVLLEHERDGASVCHVNESTIGIEVLLGIPRRSYSREAAIYFSTDINIW